MRGLQQHPDREDHIMVNLAAGGAMYIKPSNLREVTAATKDYTEVLYAQQRLRLAETAERIQELINANADPVSKAREFEAEDTVTETLPEKTKKRDFLGHGT